MIWWFAGGVLAGVLGTIATVAALVSRLGAQLDELMGGGLG